MRTQIDSTLAFHAPVDAPPTWLLSNHDVTRVVTRYGRADTSFSFAAKRRDDRPATDLDLGTKRARAAALLCLALMTSLAVETWLRFLVWLAVGLALYFGYGRRHATLARRTETGAAGAPDRG